MARRIKIKAWKMNIKNIQVLTEAETDLEEGRFFM
jgi:hypothetical protein